eukprot:6241664-Pyramimonas_sp.AAC.1
MHLPARRSWKRYAIVTSARACAALVAERVPSSLATSRLSATTATCWAFPCRGGQFPTRY